MAHSESTKAFSKRNPETAMLSATFGLQEVTSQDESFMPDISGYIRERVKEANITVYHLDPIQWWKFGVATRVKHHS